MSDPTGLAPCGDEEQPEPELKSVSLETDALPTASSERAPSKSQGFPLSPCPRHVSLQPRARVETDRRGRRRASCLRRSVFSVFCASPKSFRMRALLSDSLNFKRNEPQQQQMTWGDLILIPLPSTVGSPALLTPSPPAGLHVRRATESLRARWRHSGVSARRLLCPDLFFMASR